MRGFSLRKLPLLIRLLVLALLLGVLCYLALIAFVVIKEKTVPAPDEDTEAILVLGAQVKPDGSMSIQLTYRMELALATYRAHPQKIVVCGAQGTHEPDAEAHVMRDYLVANGVPAEDILMDDASFNTRQNMQNAKTLLPSETRKVLVVTSNYHLPRAMAVARDAGFEASGLGSPIKPLYWVKNHAREALAWVKYGLQSWGFLPY